MTNRRTFLKNLKNAGIAIPFGIQISNLNLPQGMPMKNNVIDWEIIRSHFLAADHSVINLNNGSSSNMPLPVLDFYKEKLTEINAFAPYDVLSRWKPEINHQLNRLATLMGASEGEIAFVRNTTEAINTILWGIDLKEGDEILKANWDYPYVDYSFERLKRDKGIKVLEIDDKLMHLSDEEIVQAYEDKISTKTKLIHVTGMTHREGQILPVKNICLMAKKYNIEVLVDGAHMVGHIDVDLDDLGCDYFASSLHKWLNAPLGSGVLFIKAEKMSSHQPILSYDERVENLTTRYSYLGTHAFQNMITLKAALDYLELTGLDQKSARMKSLCLRWIEALQDNPKIKYITDKDRCCGVASFSVDGQSSNAIKRTLRNKFRIHVKASGYPYMSLVRISPNIYTRIEEIDRFTEALNSII